MCVAALVSVLVLIVQQEGLLALHDYDRLCCGIKSWLQHSVYCRKCSSNTLTSECYVNFTGRLLHLMQLLLYGLSRQQCQVGLMYKVALIHKIW